MARVLLAIAYFFAIFFWLQIFSFWLGGDSSDQLVKQGLASISIVIAVFFAACALVWQLVDRFRGNSTTGETMIYGSFGVAVLLSPLIYVL